MRFIVARSYDLVSLKIPMINAVSYVSPIAVWPLSQIEHAAKIVLTEHSPGTLLHKYRCIFFILSFRRAQRNNCLHHWSGEKPTRSMISRSQDLAIQTVSCMVSVDGIPSPTPTLRPINPTCPSMQCVFKNTWVEAVSTNGTKQEGQSILSAW